MVLNQNEADGLSTIRLIAELQADLLQHIKAAPITG